jgi:hypothetical protein
MGDDVEGTRSFRGDTPGGDQPVIDAYTGLDLMESRDASAFSDRSMCGDVRLSAPSPLPGSRRRSQRRVQFLLRPALQQRSSM